MLSLSGKDNARFSAFSRRATILSGVTLAAFGGIVSRLYYLQVSKSPEYTLRAEANRIKQRLIVPLRGKVLDRFGVELATNRQDYRVIVVPEQTEDLEGSVRRLSEIIEMSEDHIKAVLKKARQQSRFQPIKISGNLSWDEFAQINIRGPELPGIEPQVGETRHYPFGKDLAHVVGYVSRANEADQEKDDDLLLRQEDFRIGKNGVEKTVDLPLRGLRGIRHVEVNAHGRVIRELRRDPGTAGQDIRLTLDMEVQRVATEILRQESGSVVVMDIQNGDVVALVSSPGFDPNGFNFGWSTKEWKGLLENPYKPLINKCIAGQYPPGSTLKPLVALAALEEGVIKPHETIYCSGKTYLGSHAFHCWKRHGHGHMNMHNAIKKSCDIYFYEVAKRMGIDKLEHYFKMFGLGEPTGLELPGEKAGLAPSRGWKKATTGVSWQKGETLITGIGQGYVLTTPLQLAVMTARIANGGRTVHPNLIHSYGGTLADRMIGSQIPVRAENLARVMKGMDGVSNESGGTALGSRLDVNGLGLAGKTGTAQVRRISKAERLSGVLKNEQLPWNFRDHALFVAFAPVENPRYAISVVVDHGGSGSKAAAPVARDVMRETLLRHPIREQIIGAELKAGKPGRV